MSGGQKARICLARALYKEADLYIFDDPLSAVDANVAKSIYENVFMDFLKGKTIILNTHQTQFLINCDILVQMKKGQIVNLTENHDNI